MFTQSISAPAPAPSPSTTSPGSHSPTPTSPGLPTARTSRLRGLSYLRNYTHNYLLNREQNTSSSGNNNSGNSGSRSDLPSAPTPSPASTSLEHTATYPLRQTRSAPFAPTPPASVTTVTATAVGTHHQLHGNSAEPGVSDAATHPHRTAPPTEQAPGSTTESTAGAATFSLQTAHRFDQPLVSFLANDNNVASDSLTTTDASASQPPISTVASAMTRSRSATEPGVGAAVDSSNSSLGSAETLPSIRLSPFHDPRATRPSLRFAPMARTLPTGSEVIRVGRYSERDGQPNAIPSAPSAAHVGFKSKVVSRRHCEFWYEGNQWYIRDVKSSSGTFLNHIRLSAPGTESKPYEVKDGDIVQLGIDFKGGEEMIFRCVKMRVELNRNWQNKLNPFNITSHKRLRNLTKSGDADGTQQSSQDCSICLNSVAPCQSLFVAPCSHTWHYKCIRTLLETKNYPNFTCPNCRMSVDLEADVEDPPEEWQNMELDDNAAAAAAADPAIVPNDSATSRVASSEQRVDTTLALPAPNVDIGDTTMQVDAIMDDLDNVEPVLPTVSSQQHRTGRQDGQQDSHLDLELGTETHVSHATSHPMPIPASSRFSSRSGSVLPAADGTIDDASGSDSGRTPPSLSGHHVVPPGPEGPITPRNDAGPWVFDGSGIRIGTSRASIGSRNGEMRSLDTAAAEISRNFEQL
ncbi:hypothetical protein SEPCBS119000_002109 [Sporothrix epigloea]|uniref:Fha domain containing protein n=1 Tax=Sporothrix epigloea TaxID=1892477 RepID=A0ABP0DED4_9PEZI